MEVLSQIAAILQDAVDKIEVIEAGDFSPRKYQIVSALQRQVTQIRTNIGDDPLNSVAPEFPPLVLKKDLAGGISEVVNAKVSDFEDRSEQKPIHQIFKTPQEVEADELNATLEILVPQFPFTDNTALRETYSDLEIQGVAKKVGAPVPEVVNLDAIQGIKDFIAKKEEIRKAGELDKTPAENTGDEVVDGAKTETPASKGKGKNNNGK
jgi:hypothetical protein